MSEAELLTGKDAVEQHLGGASLFLSGIRPRQMSRKNMTVATLA